MFERFKNEVAIFYILLFISVVFMAMGCTTKMKLMDKGREHASRGNWDKSLQFFQKAYEANPDDPEVRLMYKKAKYEASMAHMEKGEFFLHDGMFMEALSEFRISATLDPTNQKAGMLIKKTQELSEAKNLVKQAHNLLQTNKYTEARKVLEKALRLDPNNERAKRALSYYQEISEDVPAFRLKMISDKPVSFKFKQTPIMNVFEVLARLSGVNFIFDKDIQESKVTLYMNDVPFDRFLEMLLSANNLSAKLINHNTILIYPNTSQKVKEYGDLQIRTIYLSHLKAKQAVSLLSKILKSKDIIANEELNAIIIRGSRQLLEIASKIIRANDQPTAEVLLNVEVLEVSITKEQQLGLQFSESVTLGAGESAGAIDNTSGLALYGSLYATGRISDKELMVSLPTATLNMLKQDGDTRVLAKPQIRVKSAEKSSIHIGERVPLRTNRKVDTNNNVTYDYEYQDIGIKLDAVPHININDEVTLELNIEKSSLGPNVGTTEDPQYSIRARTVKSVLTVRDGESVIIGGLINDEEKKSLRKIPFLGDIPLFGHLFSSIDEENINTDILMAITPIVIKGQPLPNEKLSNVWSGTETHLSQKEPFEFLIEKSEKYQHRPHQELFDNLDDIFEGRYPIEETDEIMNESNAE